MSMGGRIVIRRAAMGLLTFCLVAVFCVGGAPRSFAAKKNPAKPVRLFGTLEFKGTLKKLPKWLSVLRRMQAWKGYFKDTSTASLPSKAAWKKLQQEAQGLSTMKKLALVNRFFNQWPYRLDSVNYGIRDYWATPAEFLKKSGDCEDYAIAKFYALKELGFSPQKMRIVALRDAIRNVGHAVLVVYLDKDVYVLDNQTNMILPHSKYKHYIPQYSVDEKYRWMHVPQKRKNAKK